MPKRPNRLKPLTPTPMTTPVSELRRLLEAATPGEWSIWHERTDTRDDAVAELTAQVASAEPFAGAVFLLDAGGKCPALTGCGPTSEANAEAITAAINYLRTNLGRIEAMEAENAALREALADMLWAFVDAPLSPTVTAEGLSILRTDAEAGARESLGLPPARTPSEWIAASIWAGCFPAKASAEQVAAFRALTPSQPMEDNHG